MRSEEASAKLISHYDPKSPISESFRTLRTNIQFAGINREIKSIMVTSAGPGEGKSTVISNLAITMAQARNQVLLIDADLRKPSLHDTFQLTSRKGLTDLLISQANLDQVVCEGTDVFLDIIPAGKTPPNPADLLGSRRMKELLEEFRTLYDIILIDAPPTLAVTDPQLLANCVDGVLLVMKSGGTHREDAKKAKALLDHVGANIIGAVLNSKKVETMAYY
ncbi:capsular exopolysaccharide synthesis family protein [Melghirimyces profundicolus]|uniref:non-specific protein-tyrosine kinase n=1 Tax=Melghirimyces profundicolus TaxID=1242148 RepID=A0A2T6BCH4_9BACL|nr:CpsD/CapB family tyrosine-protein kinase [Melghirimyces profundicolus]PTX53726.1 capsular exopolysaccharide synthesis family protein [Melghirimyces profundicolus]